LYAAGGGNDTITINHVVATVNGGAETTVDTLIISDGSGTIDMSAQSITDIAYTAGSLALANMALNITGILK